MIKLTDLAPHFGNNVTFIIDGIEKEGKFSAIRSNEIWFCGEWIKKSRVGYIEVIAFRAIRYPSRCDKGGRMSYGYGPWLSKGFFLSKKTSGGSWRDLATGRIRSHHSLELQRDG